MRGSVAWIACLALVLWACAGPVLPPDPSRPTARPHVAASASSALESPGSSSPVGPAALCPGRTWPPYSVGGIAGITVMSRDRATLEITNRADRTYYYRVSGWQLDQFETCRGLAEVEAQRGPIDPGATERVMIDPTWWQTGAQVTVALWDQPCGEACGREPVGAMQVELSPLEPAAS